MKIHYSYEVMMHDMKGGDTKVSMYDYYLHAPESSPDSNPIRKEVKWSSPETKLVKTRCLCNRVYIY